MFPRFFLHSWNGFNQYNVFFKDIRYGFITKNYFEKHFPCYCHFVFPFQFCYRIFCLRFPIYFYLQCDPFNFELPVEIFIIWTILSAFFQTVESYKIQVVLHQFLWINFKEIVKAIFMTTSVIATVRDIRYRIYNVLVASKYLPSDSIQFSYNYSTLSYLDRSNLGLYCLQFL